MEKKPATEQRAKWEIYRGDDRLAYGPAETMSDAQTRRLFISEGCIVYIDGKPQGETSSKKKQEENIRYDIWAGYPCEVS